MPQAGRRKGRQLSPEEKWELFLEVTSKELTQADALAAFAASKPSRPRAQFEIELEAAQAENARLSEALKEMAVELTLVREQRVGLEPRPAAGASARRHQGAAAQARRRRGDRRLGALPGL